MPQTWSAYVDVVSIDGKRALVVRVSHDPDADRAEIWVHAFIDGRQLAHMSAHPCPPLAASTTGEAHQQIVLDLIGGQLHARVMATETDRITFGEGPTPLRVSLSWPREGHQGSNLRGRDERLLRVNATVTVDGRSISLSGWGHQHTQLQEQPRFSVPFTYCSLRGEEAGLVGLIATNLQRGFGRLRDQALNATALRIDPPAVQRTLQMTTSDTQLEGILTRTYRYWIPMGGVWRDSSIVAGILADVPVSGVINDYAGPVG